MDGSPASMAGTERESEHFDSDDTENGELQRSLFDDVEAIVEDGRTYLDAEIQYQKTRAAFVADRAKDAAIFAAIGGALALLALVALTVGLVIALAPDLTAWGAVALVTSVWAVLSAIFLRMAARRWNRLVSAFVEHKGNRE
jgi:uncharacterized membrane protein YqjE